jgi:hypothetical protein
MPEPSTIERQRDDIDRGATHDKVPGHDPAAAPLGADEEAAGTPVANATVAQDQHRQRHSDGEAPAAAAEPSGARSVSWAPLVAIVAIAVAVIAALIWL